MEPHIFIALVAGLLPALFWLWFWLHQDAREPEPKRFIIFTFLAGMAIVPLALPLQKIILTHYDDNAIIWLWVIVEEVLKYVVAAAVILWHREVDEPIDALVYMITIALGFAALENALFIFNPLVDGNIRESIVTGAFRFLGATLLHVLASGVVGTALALSFYKKNSVRLLFVLLGLVIAIVIHGLFNVIIMQSSGATILGMFFLVWMGIIGLFFCFEKGKRLYRLYPRNARKRREG